MVTDIKVKFSLHMLAQPVDAFQCSDFTENSRNLLCKTSVPTKVNMFDSILPVDALVETNPACSDSSETSVSFSWEISFAARPA